MQNGPLITLHTKKFDMLVKLFHACVHNRFFQIKFDVLIILLHVCVHNRFFPNKGI